MDVCSPTTRAPLPTPHAVQASIGSDDEHQHRQEHADDTTQGHHRDQEDAQAVASGRVPLADGASQRSHPGPPLWHSPTTSRGTPASVTLPPPVEATRAT